MLEKRWAMPDPKCPATTTGLALALALLALMLVVSSQVSGLAPVSTHSDYLRKDFARSAGPPTIRLGPALATESIRKIKALPSANEEEEGAEALVEPRVSFRVFSSFSQALERHRIVPRPLLSPYPLRC
jgi:hypothetical protein